MTTLTGEIRDLEDSQKSANTAVEEYKSAVDEATATADGYMDAANQMNQADASRTESLAGASDAQQQASQASITAAGQELEAYNNLSEGQQELAGQGDGERPHHAGQCPECAGISDEHV